MQAGDKAINDHGETCTMIEFQSADVQTSTGTRQSVSIRYSVEGRGRVSDTNWCFRDTWQRWAAKYAEANNGR